MLCTRRIVMADAGMNSSNTSCNSGYDVREKRELQSLYN